MKKRNWKAVAAGMMLVIVTGWAWGCGEGQDAEAVVYESLGGTWSYTGRLFLGTGGYEDHWGSANVVEVSDNLNIFLSGTWYNSINKGTGTESLAIENVTKDDDTMSLLLVQTVIPVNSGQCTANRTGSGSWTSFNYMTLTINVSSIDCSPAFTASGTFEFQR